jgi:hypothetical protein
MADSKVLGRIFRPKRKKVELSIIIIRFKNFTLHLIYLGWIKETRRGATFSICGKKSKCFRGFGRR